MAAAAVVTLAGCGSSDDEAATTTTKASTTEATVPAENLRVVELLDAAEDDVNEMVIQLDTGFGFQAEQASERADGSCQRALDEIRRVYGEEARQVTSLGIVCIEVGMVGLSLAQDGQRATASVFWDLPDSFAETVDPIRDDLLRD